jgi:hypothetical protein
MIVVVPALLLLASAAASGPPFSCGPPSPTRGLPFCDRSLPAARRAADLVSRLTVAEKVSQMGDEAPGVARLGVPPYKWWSEGLHGLSYWGHGLRFNGTVRGVTSFPQVLLTAATFDEGLWYRIGRVRIYIRATPTQTGYTYVRTWSIHRSACTYADIGLRRNTHTRGCLYEIKFRGT